MKAVLSLAFVLGFVMAHDFYITQPWAETKWKAGETVKITWKLYKEVGPEAYAVNIDLMDGEDMTANFLQNIASELDPDSTSFDWTIPASCASGEGLFIRITGKGEVPNYRFSHRFTVVGGEKPAETMSAIPPVSPTVNVDDLIRKLPPARKDNKIPPAVSIIDPEAAGFETETKTVDLNFVNRDRLAQSEGRSILPSLTLLFVGILALAL